MKRRKSLRRKTRRVELLEEKRLLAGDLIAQWRADDLNETVDDQAPVAEWLDSLGDIPAANRGIPILVKGQIGGRSAIRFDASDGNDAFRITTTNNPLDGADAFSIVVVFSTDSTDLQGGTEKWFDGSGLVDATSLGLSRGWGVSINASGQIGVGTESGFAKPTTSVFSSADGLNDGQTHTIAFTRDGSNIAVYVDDLPADSRNDANADSRAVTEVSFGDLLSSTGGFTGHIAEVRFFNGALDAAEVAQVRAQLDTYYNNGEPEPQPDAYTLAEDVLFFFVPPNEGVLANDSDPEGDPLTAILVDAPQHGTVTLQPTGALVYDPDPDFFGEDSFTYSAFDIRPSAPATVSINVTPTYDAAVAQDDEYKSLAGQVFTTDAATGVLGNDTNVDRSPLTAVVVRDVEDGQLTLNQDGSFRYDPRGFAGVTTLAYQIDDGTGLSNTATATLIINTPPDAVDDEYTVNEDELLVADAARGVMANDVDAEGDALTPTLVDEARNGIVTFHPDGSFSYQPNADFFGGDAFTYRIEDFTDQSPTTATVNLNVIAVNDAPVARADLFVTFVDEPLSVSADRGVLANDIDVDSQELTVTLLQQAEHGVVELDPSGSLTFTPQNGFVGTDLFTYRVNDTVDDSQEVTASLVVAPADQKVVINEVHYDPPDNTVPAEFIELHNQGNAPVDISNWFFTDGVSYVIPEGTLIPAFGYLAIAQDPATLKAEFNADSIGPYSGRLSSEGETIALRNVDGEVVDRVDYRQGFPWPVAAGGDGPSIELIQPALDNSLGGSWRSSLAPTPGAANGLLAANAPPQTRQVSHSPQQPAAGEATTITARVTDPNGVASVQLEYQVVLPGQYIPALLPLPIRDLRRRPDDPREMNPEYMDPANWTTLGMVDDGSGGDETAGDGIYSAVVPGHEHRTLMRYRITVADTIGASVTVPYEDDASRNFAYFVYNGVPDYNGHSAADLQTVPVYHVIARNEDVTTMMAYSARDQISQGTQARFAYNWPSTFVYDGAVYDNINMRLRGANGRYHLSGKRSMRFRFNDGHYFQAHNQEGELIGEKWRTLTTGKMFDNRQTQTWALNENINMYLFNQIGVPASETFYVHFRVIDGEQEAPDQWSGDFWGLNFIIETYDVRFLDNHNLERGNLYKLINQTRNWEQQQRYQAPDAVNDGSDHDTIERDLRGRSTAEYIDAHVKLEKYFLYHAFTEAIRHYDYWPDANKNMVYYFEPDYLPENENLGKLWILPWDTDASWGPTWNSGHDVVYNSIFPASGGGSDRDETPELWPEYYNTVREIGDLLWRRDQIEPLVDQFAAVLKPLEQADLDRWRGGPAEDGRHNGLTGAGTQGIDALVTDMKNFAFEGGNWPGGGVGRGGREAHLERLQDSRGEGDEIPETPTMTYTGDPNFSADGLKFGTSAFIDPQGNDSFAAIEWRIAEVTDPTAPAFDPNAKLHLEWNARWETELSQFDAEIVPPTSAVEAGHAYRARVRMKDNTGRWSHWSEPVQFVASAATSSELVDSLRISEIHFHPADPSQAEVTAGHNDADDFEFLELVNIGNTTIGLSGAQFVQHPFDGDPQGIEFDFLDSSIKQLAPGETVLVVEDVEAFEFRYGTEHPVAGQWSGALSNAGEQLTLLGDGFVVHQFVYADDWHPETDGNGPSLERTNPSDPDLASWGVAQSWIPSQPGGSPGSVGPPVIVGDSNDDGIFDMNDLLLVFQAGEYEDGNPNNSTLAEGDWNGDGDFDSSDLVFAFKAGNYLAAAGAAQALNDIAGNLTADPIQPKGRLLRQDEAPRVSEDRRRETELLLQTRDQVFDEFDIELMPDADLPDVDLPDMADDWL